MDIRKKGFFMVFSQPDIKFFNCGGPILQGEFDIVLVSLREIVLSSDAGIGLNGHGSVIFIAEDFSHGKIGIFKVVRPVEGSMLTGGEGCDR